MKLRSRDFGDVERGRVRVRHQTSSMKLRSRDFGDLGLLVGTITVRVNSSMKLRSRDFGDAKSPCIRSATRLLNEAPKPRLRRFSRPVCASASRAFLNEAPKPRLRRCRVRRPIGRRWWRILNEAPKPRLRRSHAFAPCVHALVSSMKLRSRDFGD